MNQFDQAPVNGEAIEESIAIVCNGNTAPKAIAAGQYLFIKNHSTLATGGYHATDAIASGDTLSSSNVAADSDGIANAITAKYVNTDISLTIAASNWASTSPYTYTWTDSRITANCSVDVDFADGAEDCEISVLDYVKATGSITFTADVLPTQSLPLIIHVTNAEATSVASTSADMVSQTAISGQSTVEGALGALYSNLTATNNRTLTKRYYQAVTINTTNITWSWSTAYLQLVGDLILYSSGISPKTAPNDWLRVATVESSYKPTYEVRAVCVGENGSSRIIKIDTDGNIEILKPELTAYWFTLVWMRNISN